MKKLFINLLFLGIIFSLVGCDFFGRNTTNTQAILQTTAQTVETTAQTVETTTQTLEALYEVSFDSMGGSEIDSLYVEKGTSIQLPQPTREGYTFVGWFTGGGPNDSRFTVLSTVTFDITLYARWTINQYTITFNSNKGSIVNAITQDYDTSVNAPADPIKEGYTFGGWYRDEALTEIYIFTTMPKENITLYANWLNETVLVSFETNSDDTMDDLEVIKNSSISTIESPLKEGYLFAGWFYDQLLTEPFDVNHVFIEHITLYAKWTIDTSIQYTLNYYLLDDVQFEEVFTSTTDSHHTMTQVFLISKEHRVFAFGNNQAGQLGTGTLQDATEIVEITEGFNLSDQEYIVKISAGEMFTLAYTNQNRLFAWGNNDGGLLTYVVTNQFEYQPIDITQSLALQEDELIMDLASGSSSAYVLTTQGRVFSWGQNSSGQLGNGTYDSTNTPLDITNNFGFTHDEKPMSIKAGHSHVILFTDANRIFTWGNNSYGQLGKGDLSSENMLPQDITQQFDLTSNENLNIIAAGAFNTFVSTSRGRLFGFGINFGQFGDNNQAQKDSPFYMQMPENILGDNVVSIDAGYTHVIFTTERGRVFVSGLLEYGKLGQGDRYPVQGSYSQSLLEITKQFHLLNGEQIMFVAASVRNTYAISSSGNFFAWGDAHPNHVPNLESSVEFFNTPKTIECQSATLYQQQHYHINQDIEILSIDQMNWEGWFLDSNSDTEFQLEKMPNQDMNVFARKIDQIELSYHKIQNLIVSSMVSVKNSNYTFILTEDHRVFVWGNASTNSMFGYELTASQPKSKEITHLFHLLEGEYIVKIDTGSTFVVALTNHGNIYTFGEVSNGQLGYEIDLRTYRYYNEKLGTIYPISSINANNTKPSLITKEFDLNEEELFIDIFCTSYSTYVLTNQGRLFAFGKVSLPTGSTITGSQAIFVNPYFELDTNETIIDIQMGFEFTVILTSKGSVLTFGRNDFGQLGNGSKVDNQNVQDITASFGLESSDQIIKIVSGNYHTIAVSKDQRVFAWGANLSYQLGFYGDTLVAYEITHMFDFNEDEIILDAVASGSSNMIVTNQHRVFTFGSNYTGSLGIGMVSSKETVKEITHQFSPYQQDIVAIAMTSGYGFAVSESGTVFVFGGDQHNSFGFGVSNYISTPIMYPLRGFVAYNNASYLETEPIQLIEYSYDDGFRGWYTDESLETIFDIDAITYQNNKLYAKFNIVIDFVTHTETSLDALECEYGTSVLSLPTVEKDGYLFVGWYEDEAFTKRVDEIVRSQTLHARFIEDHEEERIHTEGLIIRYVNGSYHVFGYDEDITEDDIVIPRVYTDGIHGYGYVTHIRSNAFLWSDFISYSLPDTITHIENNAFALLQNNAKIFFDGDAPTHVDQDAFSFSFVTIYRMENKKDWPINYFYGVAVMVYNQEIQPLNTSLSQQVELWNQAAMNYADVMYVDSQLDWTQMLYTHELEEIDALILLSNSITEGLTTDEEKVDAIYQWVSSHIDYSYDHGHMTAYEAYIALQGVCAQYAMLLNELLRIQNIPSLFVSGYTIIDAENFNDLIEGSDDFETTRGHAINFVYVNDAWMIIDATQNKYDVSLETLNTYFIATEVEGVTYVIEGMDLTLYDSIYHYQGELVYIEEGNKQTVHLYSITFNQVLKFIFRSNKDETSLDDQISHGHYVMNDWLEFQGNIYYARFDGNLYTNTTVLIDGYLCAFDSDGILISKVLWNDTGN